MTEDKIVILNKRLKEVVDKFNDLKKCGMDEEILVIYLQSKTKLSQKQIRALLKNMEEFYEKLCDEDLLKAI